MIEQVARLGMLMVVGIFVARHLGREGFGFYSYILSYVSIFTYISTLGLKNIVQRDLVKADSNNSSYMGSAFILHLIGAGTSVLIIFLSLFLFDQSFETKLYILGFSATLFFNSFQVIEYYFHAKLIARYTVISRLISALLSNILKIYFIATDSDVVWFLFATGIEFVFTSVLFLVAAKLKSLKFREWKFNKSIAVKLFGESKFLVLSGVIAAIYLKIDQLMITNMMDNSANGDYAAAVRLSESWYFIPIVLSNSILPSIVYAKDKEERFYHKRLQQMHDIFAWIAIPMAIIISFSSGWLIELVYTNKFEAAAEVLSVHIWAAIFIFIGMASDKWLIIEKKYKIAFNRNWIGAVSNIVLNMFLIPAYGIIGAAYATLISYSIASYFAHLIFPSTRVIFWMQTKSFIAPIRHIHKLPKLLAFRKNNFDD